MTPFGLVNGERIFTLKMETAGLSETLVPAYHSGVQVVTYQKILFSILTAARATELTRDGKILNEINTEID
jgi:hypothetical protein